MIGFIIWLVIGAIAGFLASKVLTGKGMGILWDVVVGILGGFVGGFLLSALFHFSADNYLEQIVIAFVGAIILLLIFRALTSRGKIRT